MQELLLVNKTKFVRLFLIRRFILLVTLLVSNPFYSWQDPTISLPNRSSVLSRAANCTPATGRKFLEFNNVSALIETGGSMWLDRSRGKNAYEVPKGSGNTLIYIGALWMGGMDVNNQLKIAALRYRIGNDFGLGHYLPILELEILVLENSIMVLQKLMLKIVLNGISFYYY